MKIAIGCDHGAYALKEILKKYLTEKGYEVSDEGTYSTESCDYPVFAHKVANKVAAGDVKYGILCCTTGIGMSIAANKITGCRAALLHDEFSAEKTRQHNNSNILCMGAAIIESEEKACKIAEIFLNTEFEGGRHQRRVDMFE